MGIGDHWRPSGLCVVTAAMLLSACGQAGTQAATSTQPATTTITNVAGGESVDFTHPDFAPALKVAADSIPSASQLPFAAVFPTATAGTPATVWATNADSYPAGLAFIGASWDTNSPVGAFFLNEALQPGYNTQSDIDQMINGCANCSETKLVQITPTIRAALRVASQVTSVIWIQGDYLFELTGPVDTFSAADSQKVASETATKFAATAASPAPTSASNGQ